MAAQSFSNTLWYHTQMLADLVDDRYQTVASSLNLRVLELHVIVQLYSQDRQRPSDLAAAIGRAATSFTPVVDALIAKGWIAREQDPRDRRAIRLVLTDKAHQARKSIEKTMRELDTQLHGLLTDDDLEALAAIREKLR